MIWVVTILVRIDIQLFDAIMAIDLDYDFATIGWRILTIDVLTIVAVIMILWLDCPLDNEGISRL